MEFKTSTRIGGILIIAFLLFSACEDPSSVGLGLVGGEGGSPVVQELHFTRFTAGADASNGIRNNTVQMLVGTVDDPIMGQVQARGFIDFRYNSNQTSTYRNGIVNSVILRLEPTYVYGDTTQEMTVALYDPLAEFPAAGATADDIPPLGVEISRFSFFPTDSLISVSMPADWVASKDSILRVASFDSLFYGLHLAPVSGNAVVGFANVTTSSSALRSIVENDTVNFLAVKSLTEFERITEPGILPNRLAVQNGVGPILNVDFDLSNLSNVAMNRANLRFNVDTLGLPQTANFVRPSVSEISLYGITNDSIPVFLEVGSIQDSGILDFQSEALRSFLQAFVLGADPFERYELRFPVSEDNTLNALVLFDTTAVSAPPSITLTTTPLD